MTELYNAPQSEVENFIKGYPLVLMNFIVSLTKDGSSIELNTGVTSGSFRDPEKFKPILLPSAYAASEILQSWVSNQKWVDFIESEQDELYLFDLQVNYFMSDDDQLSLLAFYTSLSSRGSDFAMSLEGERARLLIQEMVGTELENIKMPGSIGSIQ
ncbi:hypothetical protein [uncultured Methanospirillum sp.]|uniref:hypothetical protein n=1 Tax=uncultured Methanospirillum sp. TaxID=262503 RepID=UPI0029C8DB29|nr:hypothetical protein [uncultured Methanospirillum sp.]